MTSSTASDGDSVADAAPVVGKPDDIAQWPASSLFESMAEDRLLCADVVRAHADRIERLNPAINAIVQSAVERALSEATTFDSQGPGSDRRSGLGGLPFTAKDNFETQGVVTAIGMLDRAGTTPDNDAALIQHTRRLGGILLGKTNCPPGGAGLYTDNDVYGRTNNPYDHARTPGGSSGGEAAAIATGMSPFGFGTDSGGSVRVPAHFCGIAAVLPTARLLPVAGVLDDDGPIGPISDPRTRVGIMARTVTDLEFVLRRLLPIKSLREPTAPLAFHGHGSALASLRIAVHTDNEIAPPTDETTSTLKTAAATLEAVCEFVSETAPPAEHDLTHEVWRSYGGKMPSGELYSLMRRWDAYRREMMVFFSSFDALISPVFDTPAPVHGRIEVEGEGVSYTTPYSLTECPSAVVRCGTSPEGLPIGVQIVAAPWRDDVVLTIAAHLEEALGGWSPPPEQAIRGAE
jgi:amidase